MKNNDLGHSSRIRVIKDRDGVQKKIINYFRNFKLFNRRRYARFKAIPQIACVCIYTEAGQSREYQASLIDISKVGFLILTYGDKILPGTEVEIRLQLANQPEVISVHGITVRTFRREDRDWYYSGVKFENEKEKGIKVLLDYIINLTK